MPKLPSGTDVPSVNTRLPRPAWPLQNSRETSRKTLATSRIWNVMVLVSTFRKFCLPGRIDVLSNDSFLVALSSLRWPTTTKLELEMWRILWRVLLRSWTASYHMPLSRLVPSASTRSLTCGKMRSREKSNFLLTRSGFICQRFWDLHCE